MESVFERPSEDDNVLLSIAKRTIWQQAAKCNYEIRTLIEASSDMQNSADKVRLTLAITDTYQPIFGIQLIIEQICMEQPRSFGKLQTAENTFVTLDHDHVQRILRGLDPDLRSIIAEQWIPTAHEHFRQAIEAQGAYDGLKILEKNILELDEQIRKGALIDHEGTQP